MKKAAKKVTIRVLIATSVAFSLAGGYFATNHSSESRSQGSESPDKQHQDKVLGEIRNAKSIGTLSRSTMDVRNSGSFRFGGEQAGKALIDQNVESRFRGDLEEIVFEDEGSRIKSYVIPSGFDISLIVNGQEAKALAQEISQDLASGFIVIRDRSGLVLDVVAPASARDVSSDFSFAIANAMQFSFPEGPLRSEWESQEQDGNGDYLARYDLQEQKSDTLLVRRDRVLYSKLNATIEGNIGGNSLASRTSGELAIEYDLHEQAVRSAAGTEKLEILDETSKRIGSNEQTLQWQLKESGIADGDKLASILTIVQEKFGPGKTYKEKRDEAYESQIRAMYEVRLGQDNLDTILRSLQDIDPAQAEDSAKKQLTNLFLKARALVYLHPEELPRIQDLLKGAAVDSPWFQTMTSALLNISSPEAQRVLADLALERRQDPKAMEALIPDLGFIQNPQSFVEDAIQTLRGDASTKSMADLAFATMGSQLGKDSSAEAKDRLKTIVQDIHAGMDANDAETMIHKLDMIGNLSSNESLPLIADSLKHADPRVRSVAAFALRDLTSSEAEATIRNVLVQEKDAEVRKNAAMALQNYRPSQDLLAFETDVIGKEENDQVRIQLLIAIAKAKYVDGELVRQAIETRSKQDSQAQVQNYADLLLAEMPGR